MARLRRVAALAGFVALAGAAGCLHVHVPAPRPHECACRHDPDARPPDREHDPERDPEPVAGPREFVPATAGRDVIAGQVVLARWHDATWCEARVQSVGGDGVVVAWADGSAPTALARAHVAPPPGVPAALPPGAVAYCKWSTDTRWCQARVNARHGGRLTIAHEDGYQGQVGATDCIAAVLQ